jgi:hypothetical protein
LNRALHLHQGALESQSRLGRINLNRQENGDPMIDINKVLEERGRTHGDFADVARVEQALKETLRSGKNWNILSASHRTALEMIVHKAARILSGNPNEPDHFLDIQGYAGLGLRASQGSCVRDGISDAAARVISTRPISARTLAPNTEARTPTGADNVTAEI